MRFTNTAIDGVVLIELEKKEDERGFFVRTWDDDEFKKQGLFTHIVQSNTSYNAKRGTLRGMHYQEAPYAEAKLVRCTRGAVYDVALDLRKDSPTFGKWFGVELSAEDWCMLHIPKGCAHGFQTLENNTEVFYNMDEPYRESAGRSIRYDDPAFEITWPAAVSVISEKDRSYPNWKP